MYVALSINLAPWGYWVIDLILNKKNNLFHV